jgi:hypothetical protein
MDLQRAFIEELYRTIPKLLGYRRPSRVTLGSSKNDTYTLKARWCGGPDMELEIHEGRISSASIELTDGEWRWSFSTNSRKIEKLIVELDVFLELDG